MLNQFNSVYLNYGLCIIFYSYTLKLWTEASDTDKLESDLDKQALVELRAVFINCKPNDNPASPDTEAARFQREELFKHNYLKDCNTKLALILKLSSLPEGNSDQYIPIDHVVEGPSKRRVRLLNPYVLRLRWDNPMQAYKLQNRDTVTGVFADNENRSIEKIHPKLKKDRIQRSKQGLANSLGPTSLFTADYAISPLPSVHDHNIGLRQSTDFENYLNSTLLRKKRQQHNIVVDPRLSNEDSWLSDFGDTYTNEGPNRDVAEGANVPHHHEIRENSIWKKTKHNFDKHVPHTVKCFPKHHFSPKKMSSQTNGPVHRDRESLNDVANSDLDLDRQHFRDLRTSTERSEQAINDIYSPENTFSIYEIGSPDIWCVIHVQLFEKLTTPEGKTVWNDITRGETASVSSVSPEWKDMDIHVRYRSAEWTSQDQFTLPTGTNLCLLVPRSENGDDSEYIIVPTEDVVYMNEDEVTLHKRNENNSKNEKRDASNTKHRKVLVRTGRSIRYCTDDMNVVEQGSSYFLTLPHRRPHHIQIDIETRADDNQLIRVGADGRITTAVSDNSRRTRTVFTVQATNTGLAAAKFKIKTRDCGPELSSLRLDTTGAGAETEFVLIPPKHTKRISLDLPVELPGDVAHCSVALINQDEVSVAIRDVTIKNGDRCFCVWHCDCVCLSEDPKLLCREMSESRLAAAGLQREHVRRTRDVDYPDCKCVNVTVRVIGVLFVLFLLGFLKACVGLIVPRVGILYLDKIVELPRRLQHYHETSLAKRLVTYDEEGWPLHPDTGERTVRLLSRSMEFMLNLIFFIVAPCMIVWNALRKLCSGKSTWRSNVSRSGVSRANFQEDLPRLRLRRTRRLRQWMTPEADDLSANLWRQGLLPQRSYSCKFMEPLLHEDDSRADGTQTSSVDSEQDDTEYVLSQMQKSKESLAKTQMMNASKK